MNNSRLQVGLDISQKRLDVCAMSQDGQVILNHQSFANNLKGYSNLCDCLLAQLKAGGFSGLDIAGESTGYYWLPLFLHLAADETWQAYDLALYL
jgi:transposase